MNLINYLPMILSSFGMYSRQGGNIFLIAGVFIVNIFIEIVLPVTTVVLLYKIYKKID